MSLTSTSADGCNPLSASAKESVRDYLGERCIICAYPAVTQVAHIIPRRVQANSTLYAMRAWSPLLAAFRKSQLENLLILCPNHHAEYDLGMFTIIPTAKAREQMIKHENLDYAQREEAVQSGIADKGRTFALPSELDTGFEIVPISVPHYVDIYDRTEAFPTGFVFDSVGGLNPYNRPQKLYPYPLLATAAIALSSPHVKYNAQGMKARTEVLELCSMYGRHPQRVPRVASEPTWSSWNVPEDTRPPSEDGDEKRKRKGKGKGKEKLPIIPEDNTGEGGASGGGAMAMDQGPELGETALEDQGPGSSTETDTDGSDVLSGGRPPEVEIQDLLDDDDDPIVTPAALLGRLRWKEGPFKVEDLKLDNLAPGSLRYATSSDFVADPQ